jgi:chromosome segregation ATPase
MTDNTMPNRKKQDYDKFAISRAIDQVSDPQLRAFLEAVTDVVTGLSGNAQLGAIEAVDELRKEVAADRNDRGQVASFLERLEGKMDQAVSLGREAVGEVKKLEASHQTLTQEVRVLGGVVNNLGEEVSEHGGRLTAVELDVEGLRREIADVKIDVSEVKAVVWAVKAQTTAMKQILDAFPPPPEIAERMDDS